MGHKVGIAREQIEMMFCLEEMVAETSPARQIDAFVDESDTSYFSKATAKSTGCPPYNPKDMLKLYLYGMENGIISSRKLEREAKRNIELMWLLNKLTPESKTICNFRKDNTVNIVRFFKEFCLALTKKGYIDGKVMAIDGTKIRANNSKRNNFSAKKLDRHIEYINKKINSYMYELDKNDEIESLKDRKIQYESMKERLKQDQLSEISLNDPDSKLMRTANNGVDVCYNVQAVVDSKHKLIAGVALASGANDQGQLGEVMPLLKEELELEKTTVLADKGYYKTEDFKTCEDNNITTIVAGYDKAESKIISVDEFAYDPCEDVYVCPQGNKLFSSKVYEGGHKKYRNQRACRNCPLRAKCTTSTNYRTISRHIHKASAERNDKRYAENKELYKQRQMLVEHPFGTIKRTMGIRQFVTCGKESVAAEAALIFLCYNLKRLRVIHNLSPVNIPFSPQNSQILLILLVSIHLAAISIKSI